MLQSLIIQDKAYFCSDIIKAGVDMKLYLAAGEEGYLSAETGDGAESVLIAFSDKHYAERFLGEINAIYENIAEINMKDMDKPARIMIDIEKENDKGLSIIQAIYDEIHSNKEYKEFYYENASLFATVIGPILATRFDDEVEVAKVMVNTIYSFALMHQTIVMTLANTVNPAEVEQVMEQFQKEQIKKEDGE